MFAIVSSLLAAVGPLSGEELAKIGLVGIVLIIFAETGLLIGFFLPGDSLLIAAGIAASQGLLNIWVLVPLVFVAAVIGDQVGYTIGQQLGPRLFSRPDSRLFKQAYVRKTKLFFDKKGPSTVIIARFLPVARTFVPVIAGAVAMSRKTFFLFNIVGAVIWAIGVTLAGFFLGKAVGPKIENYLLPIAGIMIILSVVQGYRELKKMSEHSDSLDGDVQDSIDRADKLIAAVTHSQPVITEEGLADEARQLGQL